MTPGEFTKFRRARRAVIHIPRNIDARRTMRIPLALCIPVVFSLEQAMAFLEGVRAASEFAFPRVRASLIENWPFSRKTLGGTSAAKQ